MKASTHRSVLLSAIVLGACRPVESLQRVPIVGGTERQQQIVRDELRRFDESVGPGRVELRLVELRTAPVQQEGEDLYILAGEYRVASRTIRLDSSSHQLDLAGTTRHELCHALDHQEDLTKDAVALPFPAMADLVGVPLELEPRRFSTTEEQLRETFALLCEVGPDAAAALSEPCEADPLDLSDAYQWIDAQVYGSTSSMPTPTTLGDERAQTMSQSWTWVSDGNGAPTALDVIVGVVSGLPALTFKLSAPPSTWIIAGPYDVASGMPFDGGQAVFDPLPSEAETPSTLGSLVVEPITEPITGQRVASGSVQVGELLPFRRLLIGGETDTSWQVASTCPSEVDDVTAAGGEVWYSWLDEAVTFHWAALDIGDVNPGTPD